MDLDDLPILLDIMDDILPLPDILLLDDLLPLPDILLEDMPFPLLDIIEDDIFDDIFDDILSVELFMELTNPFPFSDILKVYAGALLSLALVDLVPLLLLDDFEADIPLLFGDLTDVGEAL